MQVLDGTGRCKLDVKHRVQALWDEAEEHAVKKGGRLSIAWQELSVVSEKHLFGFFARHGIRVRILMSMNVRYFFFRGTQNVNPVCKSNLL